MVISTLERVQNAFYTKQFFEHYFFFWGGARLAVQSDRSVDRLNARQAIEIRSPTRWPRSMLFGCQVYANLRLVIAII